MSGDALRRYVAWVRGEALSAWAERGFDQEASRFHERLDLAGQPLPVPHRSMLQARQIYVFAHAATLGWFPEGGPLADRAMATLRRDFCAGDGQGGAAFAIDPATGAIVDDARDAYAHAFLLFAAAYLHRLTGDAALLRFAEALAGFVDRGLADPAHGGLHTASTAIGADKLQNPHMHLLEAMLALAEAAPDGPWLGRAGGIVALFERRMFDAGLGILPERFAPDWQRHAEPAHAEAFEPGHHYEWAWLLRWYDTLAGSDHAAIRAALMASARRHGHAGDGLIRDVVRADGTIVAPSHRLWPHCEAIKAAVAEPGGLADPAAHALAEGAAAALLGRFVSRPFAGGWIDRFSPDGTALVDHVPASSLYHLMLAATVADAAGAGPAGGNPLPA